MRLYFFFYFYLSDIFLLSGVKIKNVSRVWNLFFRLVEEMNIGDYKDVFIILWEIERKGLFLKRR